MKAIKLLFGAGGIYAAFLYYGTLTEDILHYKAPDGTSFKQAWFLQSIEALFNVIVGGAALAVTGGGAKGLPQKFLALSGATQVCAKAFTVLAQTNSVSFPVATLAKSGKMVPVMIGGLLLGGEKYSLRQYLSVAAIIGGTAIVSMGKKSSGGAPSSVYGLVFLLLSLSCDGMVGGFQGGFKKECEASKVKATSFDMMTYTNLYMFLTAIITAAAFGEITTGFAFMQKNPIIFEKIFKFSLCSAVGQSFIFYVINEFNPLTCTIVTTTRKVFSVLLSIFINGHAMSAQGWGGIAMASCGILSELADKKPHDAPKAGAEKKEEKKH